MEQRGQGGQSVQPQERLFTTLADLLIPAATIPWIDSADTDSIDRILQCLPSKIIDMAQAAIDTSALQNPESTEEQLAATKRKLLDSKKDILRRVLRSPQFSQSLASLTIALREGGLPMISEVLKIPVRDGGYLRHGGVPMGGGEAVEVFVEGVKDQVSKGDLEDNDGNDNMDTE